MHFLIETLRRASSAFRRRHEILELARMNCCGRDEGVRKTVLHRCVDLTYSILRWNELSSLYYAQGVDVKGKSIARNYLSYTRFRKMRDARNNESRRSSAYNYACLLQDKLLFERYFTAGNLPIPRSLGELSPGGRGKFMDTSETDVCKWGELHCPGRDLFVKPRFGIKGKGVFKLQFLRGRVLVNGVEMTPRELEQRITVPCLVQEVVEQHPMIAQLHPSSLNTLRVITYKGNAGIEVFLTYLRMAGGGEIADNNMNLRAIVRVDEETGCLYADGYAISGQSSKIAKNHMDTGVLFADVTVPEIAECLEVAKAAHRWMPEFFSVGWDVAITPSGPLLLEGNDDWGATTAMWAMPDFVSRFQQMIAGKEVSLV